MGEYIDIFKNKMDQIKNNMSRDELHSEIRERMRKYWTNIPDVKESNKSIAGVDSSYQSVDLSSGYTLIVVRGCAVGEERKRDLDMFITTGEISELRSRVMENIEHKILKNYLHEVNLVDGSLYGRANHIPREFRNEGFEDFSLKYYKNYNELIKNVEKENKIIMGISKSSSSTFLRDIVVKEMYEEEMKKLNLGEEERELLFMALDHKGKAREKAEKLLKDRGYNRAYRLIMELTYKRPDMSVISDFGIGMSKPVLLGATARAERRYREIERGGEDALQRLFPNVDITESHVNTILDYLNLSAFISFYISFSPMVVMRVDFPAYVIGLNYKMMDVGWPQVIDVDVGRIISILKREYGDNYIHSIHLFAADDDVRFTHGVFMKSYLPIIMDTLGVNPSMGSIREMFRR